MVAADARTAITFARSASSPWWKWRGPRCTRLESWEYDRVLYRRRNEVERLFRRLKRSGRIFSRFDKLDVMFLGFLHFALIVEARH